MIDVQILGPKRNLDVRLLLELYCVKVINVVLSTICAKVTLAFPLTLLFPDMVLVSDLSKKYWRTTDLAKKKARTGGFAYSYSPPSQLLYGHYSHQKLTV